MVLHTSPVTFSAPAVSSLYTSLLYFSSICQLYLYYLCFLVSMRVYRYIIEYISLIVEYLKTIRRLEKEQKNYDFLAEKMLESERDLVQVG